MKRIQLAILSVFVVISSFSQIPIFQLIDHQALKHASVGVCVKDLETGGVIVSHNGDKSLTPASVMKLVTTATALEIFGADYRYTTLLALDATNPNRILVIGSGDPTLGSDVFGGNPYEFFVGWTKKFSKEMIKRKFGKFMLPTNCSGMMGFHPNGRGLIWETIMHRGLMESAYSIILTRSFSILPILILVRKLFELILK